jgi:hypothetical protein
MTIECDICGFKTPGQPNFCSGCGVDLREQSERAVEEKKPRITNHTPKKSDPSKDELKNEDALHIIKWCWIKTLDLPHALILLIMLVNGKSRLGFCDCPICNLGFRELLASKKNLIDKRNLKSSSREIVKEARSLDITKFSMDLSSLFSQTRETTTRGNSDNKNRKDGKIIIEIDNTVIENAVLKVLASNPGQEIIRGVIKQRQKRIKKTD